MLDRGLSESISAVTSDREKSSITQMKNTILKTFMKSSI